MKTKLLLTFLLSIAILTTLKASAWVEPKQGEEIPAVLNTSSDGQEKKGWLNINNWIRVITNPFSFDVGVESPKFCIKKPDGTTSCCPPQAGQDWSACGGGNNGGVDAKWVWNSQGEIGSYDLITKDPNGIQIPLNDVCSCYNNGVFERKLPKVVIMRSMMMDMMIGSDFYYLASENEKGTTRGFSTASRPPEYCFQACQSLKDNFSFAYYINKISY